MQSRTEAVYRIMVRRGVAIPEYDQMLGESAGNGASPMLQADDAEKPGSAGTQYGAEAGREQPAPLSPEEVTKGQ